MVFDITCTPKLPSARSCSQGRMRQLFAPGIFNHPISAGNLLFWHLKSPPNFPCGFEMMPHFGGFGFVPLVIFEKNRDLKITMCTFAGRNAGVFGSQVFARRWLQ